MIHVKVGCAVGSFWVNKNLEKITTLSQWIQLLLHQLSTKLSVCIQSNTRRRIIHEERGSSKGHIGQKTQKILRFLTGGDNSQSLSDVHQTRYMYSSKYKDDPCEKGSRSRVIQGSFWAKNLENFTILSLWTQLLLEFTSDVHQTWYMYSSKYKDDPCGRGLRSGVILG